MKKILISLISNLLISQFSFASYVPNVPYFYQYNNSINPGGSCQNTSIAMCIKFFGGTSETPDAVSGAYGTNQAQTVSGLQNVFNSEAVYFGLTVRIIGHSNGTFAQIQALLSAGKPVIVHGYFTGYGHVMVLTGFTGTQYIANDPAGRWSQTYGYGGYSQVNATEGNNIYYGKNAMEDAIGPDGTIWYHEFTNVPVTVPTPTTTADVVAPSTAISVINPTNYQTTNFAASFTDSDNSGGSGLDRSFYSVLDWTGTEWRANKNKGFFCDNFDNSIHTDWSNTAGTWGISSNVLAQTDLVNTNSSLSATLNQSLSNRYIYHFLGKINGVNPNRVAGIHIFCNDITQSNRGNNYLVLMKPVTSEIQIYKVTANVIGATPIKTFNGVTINTGTWYDYKMMYDRTTGKFTIWQNDVLIGSHTDSGFLTTGTGISFRTNSAGLNINNFKVYRTRLVNTANVSIGNANADVRYQSPDPSNVSYSCKIKSLNIDLAGNISSISNQDLLIDWTVPNTIATVNDGTGVDINITNNGTILSANFTASQDINSGVVEYFYAIGTTAGATDIKAWTTNTLSLNINATGLALVYGQTYFISVKAKNGAGLFSLITSSNGQTYPSLTTSLIESNKSESFLSIYPNPSTDNFMLRLVAGKTELSQLSIHDLNGKVVHEENINLTAGMNDITINDSYLVSGIYFITVKLDGEIKKGKLVKN